MKERQDILTEIRSKLQSMNFAFRIVGILLMLALIALPTTVFASEQKISPDNGGTHEFPMISGNTVVWKDIGNPGIWLYDIPSGTVKKISSPGADARGSPAISGNRIVWMDNSTDGQYYAIYLYDTTQNTLSQLPGHPHPPGVNPAWDYFDQWYPAIYGENVAYFISNPWGPNGSHEIWVYNIISRQRTLISESVSYETKESPRIGGSRIVWSDNRMGNYDIWLYDMATTGPEKRISASIKDDKSPDIWQNFVVWQEVDPLNQNSDIILYNINTAEITRITKDLAKKNNPAISDNQIVWDDERNYQKSGLDIYRYNITSCRTDQITSDHDDQGLPRISGDHIVWQDGRLGADRGSWDIYMHTNAGLSTPVITMVPPAVPQSTIALPSTLVKPINTPGFGGVIAFISSGVVAVLVMYRSRWG